jgi:hypothetical protein
MWVDQGFEIALAAEHEDGMMQGHLRSLRKLKIKGIDVLVPPEDIEETLKSTEAFVHFTAFRRESETAF